MAFEFMQSPIGWLKLTATEQGLCSIDFDCSPTAGPAAPNIHTRACHQQLHEYFTGQRQQFELTLAPHGTAFQHRVWDALRQIPYGSTCCYQDIAVAIGNPKAMRAVGAANGRNPIPIVVPCHRVIGRNGSLIGFSGGLNKKEWLLAHEGALLL